MVKGLLYDYRNKYKKWNDILMLTNLIFLLQAKNMHKPFHEVCVRITQSLNGYLSIP